MQSISDNIKIIKTFANEGVWVDGKLVYKKDYLDATELLRAVGVKFDIRYIDPSITLTDRYEDLDLTKHERGFQL